MRMKMVCDDRTLREVANEFLALKKAQKNPRKNPGRLQDVRRQIH